MCAPKRVMLPDVPSGDHRDKNRAVTFAMHGLWRKLRKDKCERCRAFPELVGPRILLLESVDYFGTCQYFSGRKRRILMSKTSIWGKLVGSPKLPLYVNESCDAVYFRRWLKSRAMFITFLLSSNGVISFESRPLIFVLFMRNQSIQEQIVEYDIRSKYPKEYSTVDKVGSEKLSARKFCFV